MLNDTESHLFVLGRKIWIGGQSYMTEQHEPTRPHTSGAPIVPAVQQISPTRSKEAERQVITAESIVGEAATLPFSALPKLISSDELFGSDRQIFIDHAGAVYRLQITKQGKLILTK